MKLISNQISPNKYHELLRDTVPAGTYDVQIQDIIPFDGISKNGDSYNAFDFFVLLSVPNTKEKLLVKVRHFSESLDLMKLVDDFQNAGYENDTDDMIGAYETITVEYGPSRDFGFVKSRIVQPKVISEED